MVRDTAARHPIIQPRLVSTRCVRCIVLNHAVYAEKSLALLLHSPYHSPRRAAFVSFRLSLLNRRRAFSITACALTFSFCSALVSPMMGDFAAVMIVLYSSASAIEVFSEADRLV